MTLLARSTSVFATLFLLASGCGQSDNSEEVARELEWKRKPRKIECSDQIITEVSMGSLSLSRSGPCGQEDLPDAPALPGVPMPALPEVPSAPGLPAVPGAPALPIDGPVPGLPALPSAPSVPGVPMPAVPELPAAPGLPGAPALPGV